MSDGRRKNAKRPDDWDEISLWIRNERAQGRCECHGACGLHRTTPGPRRCMEENGTRAQWAKGIIVLTVAHTCECDPLCSNPEHLLALCQRCHLRLDMALHQKHAKETRELKKWRNQLPLGI